MTWLSTTSRRAPTGALLTTFSLLAACSEPTPPPASSAEFNLHFEKTLESNGKVPFSAELKDGKADYIKAKDGQAYRSPGDGQHVVYETDTPLTFHHPVEVSFSVFREADENPNPKGRVTQTPLDLKGSFEADGKRKVGHVYFAVSQMKGNIYTAFETTSGDKVRLEAGEDTLSPGWHDVRLLMDPRTNMSRLFFNGEQVMQADGTPNILATGINSVKVGTWHKTNQAFYGALDNVKIESVHGPTSAQVLAGLRR